MPTPMLPQTPDELAEVEAVPIAVGGASPWVQLYLTEHRFDVRVHSTFDVARLCGKWLHRKVRAKVYLARGVRGEIAGGYLEDLDLVEAPTGSSGES